MATTRGEKPSGRDEALLVRSAKVTTSDAAMWGREQGCGQLRNRKVEDVESSSDANHEGHNHRNMGQRTGFSRHATSCWSQNFHRRGASHLFDEWTPRPRESLPTASHPTAVCSVAEPQPPARFPTMQARPACEEGESWRKTSVTNERVGTRRVLTTSNTGTTRTQSTTTAERTPPTARRRPPQYRRVESWPTSPTRWTMRRRR